MFTSALKKIIFVLLLTLLASYISLPREFEIFGVKVQRYDLNFSWRGLNLKKNFDLVLGLDLSGGSHLVFEADTSSVPGGKVKDAIASAKEVIEARVNLFGVSEPVVQTSSFGGKERIIVELPSVKDTKKDVDIIGKTAQLVFAEISEASEEGELKLTGLTGADLTKAELTYDRTSGKPDVSIQFTSEGAEKFSELTGRNVGRTVPILLDNQVVSAPVVREQITGGSAVISGIFTVEEAKNLVIQLNAGALPLPIKLVEERTVGATLGSDSIEKSVRAGLIGLIMVILFMVLSYRKLGIVAGVGLIIFGIITLALYKLIPIVLTLPGIAGFLLSVGMAVDSNILIFERFKEEKEKHPVGDALEISFGRAWDAIRDANVATLVTAFILANPLDWQFLNVSGPVRGFAITLALGIGISLFTGIIVTRNLLRVFISERSK